jgi:large-conductance mechanosensitive channel
MKEKKKAVEPPPEMTMSEKLLVEIRDGLKNKNT